MQKQFTRLNIVLGDKRYWMDQFEAILQREQQQKVPDARKSMEDDHRGNYREKIDNFDGEEIFH